MTEAAPRPGKRILSIQACRGLAALAVLGDHLHNVELKYFPTHIMEPLHYGVIGVDVFFVISGLVISMVTLGKFQKVGEAFRFLYHRFARVYPVYWIISLIVLLAFLYNPHWVDANSHGHVEILRSFLLIPSHYQFLVMQGWTLSFEIYFYLLFFLLLLFCTERLAPIVLTLFAASMVALPHFRHIPYSPLVGLAFSPLILEFVAGCLLLRLFRRSRLHPSVGVVLLLTACAWFAVMVIWGRHNYPHVDWLDANFNLRAIWAGTFAVLLLAGLMELERTGLIRIAKPLIALGDWSYSIYLTHIIVVEFFGRWLGKRLHPIPFGIVWVALLSLAAAIGVGYLSYTWVEKPLITLLYHRDRRPASLRTN